jgi:hypothetical protein
MNKVVAWPRFIARIGTGGGQALIEYSIRAVDIDTARWMAGRIADDFGWVHSVIATSAMLNAAEVGDGG